MRWLDARTSAFLQSSFAISALMAMALLFPSSASGKTKTKDKSKPASTSLDDYMKRALAAAPDQPTTIGSLWVPTGLLSGASTDYKARLAGDLITVRLVDTFAANTSGENSTSRQFATSSAVTGLLGQVGPSNSLQNLFNANSATTLDGKGSSTMSSNLQLVIAGRVVQVMPNGTMIIEAVRDFTVGNDRQTVALRGLIRPGDVAIDNSILSSQVSSMELEIKGKGSVADAQSRPNIVVRTLLKLLSF
jgi:flagellar L-ring protein precursor FlgH